MNTRLNIALACGGTGGHIFPGLATAERLRQQGHEVSLWMAGRSVEAPAVHGWAGPVITVQAQGLPSGVSFKAVSSTYLLLRAGLACRRRMKQLHPGVLLAMGSYASVGPVMAALSLKVPVVLHEANVLPGRTVQLFARWAHAVAGSFEETRYYLRRKNLVITGMPLRSALEQAAAGHAGREPSGSSFCVLVMGGSLGAHKLNTFASQALVRAFRRQPGLRVIHLTGVADEGAMREVYQKAGVPADVHAFQRDMAALYASAHLVICRSGAATCAELSVFGLPALMVPYPFATNDHQMANARAVEKAGAADVVPERDLSEEWLADYILGCRSNRERLARMRKNSVARGVLDGAASLARLVEETALSKRPHAAQRPHE